MPIALSEAARELLLEVCQDSRGLILKLVSSGGSSILKTNGRIFGDASASEQSRWEEGIKELLRCGFVEAHGDKGGVYCVTPEGYDAAYDMWGRV